MQEKPAGLPRCDNTAPHVCHASAGRGSGDRLGALLAALRSLGARVRLGGEDNMITRVGAPRRLRFDASGRVVPAAGDAAPGDAAPGDAAAGDAAPAVIAEICVAGFPNLIHEVGHIVLRGVLDDDHGIAYEEIPFDLETEVGRAALFEELACCVLSCSFAAPPPTADEAPEQVPRDVIAWFREQVEIQPVFFGKEHRLSEFWEHVHGLAQIHAAEFEKTADRAFERTRMLLRGGGASDTLARPPRRFPLSSLLAAAS